MFRFWSSIDKDIQGSHDGNFKMLLRDEFWSELVLIARLKKVPAEERTETESLFWECFRKKYQSEGGCPSHLLPYVSRELQENYRLMHQQICGMLYE